MGYLSSILEQLDERYIARLIAIPHDQARMKYAPPLFAIVDIGEFTRVIGEYYNYHFVTCISHGGYLTASESEGRAKDILDREYRQQRGGFVGAFNDARFGTNGGLRAILDIIADSLKAESIARHMRKVLDDEVKPNSWEDKVDIISQFMSRCGPDVLKQLDTANPERYAADYEDLIRAYVDGLRKTSALFLRI
ncbi:MAG: hypothetical protein IPH59_02900 [bacterium]|nr:hypothetical protein [bacterium]